MHGCTHCLIEYKDWLILLLGCLFTILWTLFLYLFRPKLHIIEANPSNENERNSLAIKIANIGNKFWAVNLRVEACFIDSEQLTYHVDLDRADFLMLPPIQHIDHERTFKAFDIAETTRDQYNIMFDDKLQEYRDGLVILRVRVHAFHDFSGFGKAFEQKFKWNGKTSIKVNGIGSLKSK